MQGVLRIDRTSGGSPAGISRCEVFGPDKAPGAYTNNEGRALLGRTRLLAFLPFRGASRKAGRLEGRLCNETSIMTTRSSLLLGLKMPLADVLHEHGVGSGASEPPLKKRVPASTLGRTAGRRGF